MIFSGTGHWISPARIPSGTCHSIRVGAPESPAFRQYVCQPDGIFRSTPARMVSPGRAASADRSKRAWVLVAAATGTAANGRKTRRATIRLTRIPV